MENRGNKLAHWTTATKLLLTLYKEQNSCFSIHWGSSSCRAIPLSTVSLRNATVDAGTHDAHYLLQHLFHLFWPVRGQERDCCSSAFCRCDGRMLDNPWLQYCSSFSKKFKDRKNPILPLCQQIQNSWPCPIVPSYLKFYQSCKRDCSMPHGRLAASSLTCCWLAIAPQATVSLSNRLKSVSLSSIG